MSVQAPIKMRYDRAGVAMAPLLARLHAAAFHRPGDETWSERAFSDVLNSAGCFCLVAIDEAEDETPVGFAAVRVRAQESELLSLGVMPAYQRRGIAQALILQAKQGALAIGAKQMFLEVAEDNPGAYRLYCEMGFDQVGTRPDYYTRLDNQRVNARTMRSPL
jgi:ribosomal-protein-alanine N-acetyltransferase